MSSPITLGNYTSEFKGYRIRQQTLENQATDKKPETLLKVFVKNQTNGIPKIRHDVICNGKHYPFIPLFAFTSEDDLGILDQISTIVLKDENEILCEILSKKLTQIKAKHFKELRSKFNSIFALELKVDSDELFMILVTDEFSSDDEFNAIFDSISETQFTNLLKKIYENCPQRVIPKILRKITKYLNSTKERQPKSTDRLKRIMKLIKSVDESNQIQQKQLSCKKQPEPSKKLEKKQEQRPQEFDQNQTQLIKKQSKKDLPLQQSPKIKLEERSKKNLQESVNVSKDGLKQSSKVISKDMEIVNKTEKVNKKQKNKILKSQKKQVPTNQNQSDWKDVDQSNNQEEQVQNKMNKMAFHADESDDDVKYLGPKKKKKKKNNMVVPIEPELDFNTNRKTQRLKKQKKYQNSNSKVIESNFPNKDRKIQNGPIDVEENLAKQKEEKKTKNFQNQRKNGRDNNQENGQRQFSRDKKIDQRILLGINGATDLAWRQRLRPPRYPKEQKNTEQRGQNNKQNKPSHSKTGVGVEQRNKSLQKGTGRASESENRKLQKIFSIPNDIKQGKKFKFEKRNYNLFVNNLFWVNITEGQLTIQKDGKGYIRKCAVQVIDGGNGIVAEGITLNIDGLSNLQDGGVVFGDPVFQEFTPNGQWFHVTALEVYAYF